MPNRGKRENVGFYFGLYFSYACFVVARIHRVGRQLEYGLWSPETITLALRNLLIGICFDFVGKGEPKIRDAGPQPRAVGGMCRGIWDPKSSRFRNLEMRFL